MEPNDRSRHVSLWYDTLPDAERVVAEPLPGDAAVDVAIVGAGLTGLWTAYYLRLADPSLRVMVLERDHVGFGASGRNGGWCSALMPMSHETLARRHGRAAAIRMQQAMDATVDEVVRVCAAEGIDADVAYGGTIDLLRNEAQVERATQQLESSRAFGFDDDHLRWLDADEAHERCAATDVRGALFARHCATVHPARLTHGVARAALRHGAVIHDRTAVRSIEPGRVVTERGTVRAELVVRATEGYTVDLPGSKRELLPLYSFMIATEPLPASMWDEIGLAERPTFADGRHAVIYGQRTADGRFAFGGRGIPYHFGSRIRPEFDTHDRVRDDLRETLVELFPVLRDIAVTHHWGGPLGIPRDSHAAVRFDRRQGLAIAGGYVGDGVATTNLAGRTVADLATGADTDLVRLPWVGHRSRKWEPEPFRWLGVQAVRTAADRADRADERGSTGGLTARIVKTALRR